LFWAAFVGIGAAVMYYYFIPEDSFSSNLPGAKMQLRLSVQFQLVRLLCQPFVQVAITTVLILLALRKKNRPDAVVYALVSGFTLAVFVVRLIF